MREFVDFTADAPVIKEFFGREKELKRLKELLAIDDYNLIVISGMPGIGKSALAAKLLEEYKGKRNVFWCRIGEESSLRAVAQKISTFLSKIGKKRLEAYLSSKKSLDLEELSVLLWQELNYTVSLLVFDDFHKANRDILNLFTSLLDLLQRTRHVKIIVACRYIPYFYDRREVHTRNIVAELFLGGLDEKSSEKLLEARKTKVRKERLAEVHEVIKGHPLALQLIDVKNGLVTRDIKEYLRKEVCSELAQEEKNLLGIASVFRKPVKPKALLIGDANYDTLDQVVKRLLISRVSQDRYEMHDLLKEFFYSTLTPKLAKKYHLAAGNYYESEEGIASLLEAMYHFAAGDNQEKTARIAVEQGEQLINRGYLKEFMSLTGNLRPEKILKDLLPKLYILQGDAKRLLGMWDEALKCYSDAAQISNQDGKAECLLKTAHVERRRGEWKSALSLYEKSLPTLKRSGEKQLIVEAYRGMGEVHKREGRWREAIENYLEAVEVAEKMGDEGVLGDVYVDLGDIYKKKGSWGEAETYCRKSVELSEKSERMTSLSRAYNGLGDLYLTRGAYQEAIPYFKKCEESANKIGYVRVAGWALFNIGECYAKLKELEKAKKYCDEALEILEKVKDDLGIYGIYRNYAIIYRHQKEWRKSANYFKKVIQYCEKINLRYYLAYTWFEFGLMYMDKEEKENARECLENALRIWKEVGAEKDAEKAEKALAKLSNEATHE